MDFLDRSGRRLDAFARRQLFGEGFEFQFGLGKKTLAQGEQRLRVVVEEMFFLQQQIEMLFTDRVAGVAARQKMAFEKIGEIL